MASELTITSIREDVRACAAPETHCSVLRNYRDSLDHPDVRTPLLCDANADARVVFIGAIGGEITFHRPGEPAYEYNQLCGNDYTLGWHSGINLAKLLHRLYLRMPSLVRCDPSELRGSLDPHRLSTRDAAGVDRFLRRFFSAEVMPVHRTNLLKCHGPGEYKEGTRNFREAATVCCDRHLARELQALRPTVVVPLGNPATAFFVSWTQLRGPLAVRGWQAIPRERRRMFLPKLGTETIVNPYFHPSPLGWANSTEADREAFVSDLAWALGGEVGHSALQASINSSVPCADGEQRATRCRPV